MVAKEHSFCQVVGGGAAGIGLLIALHNELAQNSSKRNNSGEIKRQLTGLLDSLLMIEASSSLGGILGNYQINANTDAADAVSSIAQGTPLVNLRDQYLKRPEAQRVLMSLPKLAELLLQPLGREITDLLGEKLKLGFRVNRVVKHKGIFSTFDVADNLLAKSSNLVLCCGGKENLLKILSQWQTKVVFGGDFLQSQTLDFLPTCNQGPIVITSASHSGFSCAWRLLNDATFTQYAKCRDIIILQRRSRIKLRCDKQFAAENNIQWNEAQDVCPQSGLVFSNGGLRKDAKFLYLAIRGGVEKRARLLPIDHLCDQSDLLEKASLIIQCAGYTVNHPEIIVNGINREIHHFSTQGEVKDSSTNQVIPGLFAFGLGMHILPDGPYHGERSFNGSINGLQSYPQAIAPVIIKQLLKRMVV